MAKTKREFILATFFLSGTASIISLVALGTQEWVTADAINQDDSSPENHDRLYFGLFSGMFHQESILVAEIDLTMVCRFDLNICALLCGENMSDNLEKLYYNTEDNKTVEDSTCARITTKSLKQRDLKADVENTTKDRTFINTGVWISTIVFLIVSALFGLFSAVLAVWNTAANPIQVYFSVFGLYIYNGIASFTILLPILLWGVMYSQDLVTNVPTYKTIIENFSVEDNTSLGYSYWILLAPLFLYVASICLLYIRKYLISKEPEVNLQIEDNADPVIYLY